MRYSAGLILTFALALPGCNETAGSGGRAGAGGGGAGGSPLLCEPTTERCTNISVEPHEPCCEQGVPEQENACDGTEPLDNPASCTANAGSVTYRLTVMEAEGDCNAGYDLDACEGQSCLPGGLTPAEGIGGIDNALGGLAVAAAAGGRNLGDLNQTLSDALCGRMGEDCLAEIAPTEIRFAVDANPAEGCARVSVVTDAGSRDHILNLTDDGCLSGHIGTIPLPLAFEAGSLENAVVRMTVSAAGFSHGLLGGVMDEPTALAIFSALFGGAADPTTTWFDMNVSQSTSEDGLQACDGMSAALRIAGIAE